MKKFAITIIICLFVFSFCMSLFITKPSRADYNAIYVDCRYHSFRDGSAENPYERIQYAIDLAESGDTIYVFGGTYNESLVINKNITLIGSVDNGDTIVNKNIRHKYTVEISADYVTLESFTITNTYDNNQVALLYLKSNNIVIQGNNITQSKTWGIYFESSNDNTIGGNRINDTKGAYLYNSNNNVFSNNNFSDCTDTAISLAFSSGNCILYNNTFINCKYALYSQSSSNNNVSKNEIVSTTLDGIKIMSGSNNIFENNYVNYSGNNGFDIGSSDSKIIGNKFDNNQIGILLSGSNCQISNNYINNSKIGGIHTTSTINNIIYLNHFLNNEVYNARETGNNQWFSGTEGNYWDDYNEIDEDLNKIGDTPYHISDGGQDLYPLGYFLRPPDKPDSPSPIDGAEEVGLSVILNVTVIDPDSDTVDVYFYGATDDKLYGVDYRVPRGEVASCRFTLPFETTFLWYAVADDGKLKNQSNIWIFTTRQIPPTNEKPVANPGGPYSSLMGEEIDFDGSLSYDPDGAIDFYRWNFGDGSSEILNKQPSHSYYDSGTYTVTLTVVDNDGRSNTKTTSAYVSSISNDDPVPIISAPNSTNVDEFTTFSASSSFDIDGSITNYTWDFGDGTINYGVSTTHIYTAAGAYTVMLTVIDDNGGQDTTYNIITVNAPKEGIPGFEFILAIMIIGFMIFYKKLRR